VTKLSQPGSSRKVEHLTYLHLGRRSALSLAIAVALGLPGAVLAQDTPVADAELEEIVVTGIRAGIEQAVELKAGSGSIVEAISAEDIGKLPDTSIAESISRLPGITSQRAEGRASAISLRGTDPGFTTALLNGREQVSTGDNRSVEFDQYPSELINQVVVYKTPDAQLVGQGLAGTIDLRTVRPLDYGRQAVVVNLRGERNSHSDGDLGADHDDTGYRASLSYIDQFMDGKLGVAFGYARLNSPIATKGFGTYEPWSPMGNDNNPNTSPGFPPTALKTDGMKVRSDMGTTVRDGLMAAVQYEPNDFYSTTVDVYYSTMDQTNNARSVEVNLGGYPAPCCDGPFPNGTIFGFSNITLANNAVVAGNLNTIVPLARNFLFKTEDEILAGGWLNEFQLNDEWKLLADLSYSKATREQDQFETNAQIKPLGATATRPNNVYDNGVFALSSNRFPSISFGRNYADPNQVQVGPTIYGAGYTKAPEVEDELTSFRVDAVREAQLWWFSNQSFGLNYSDRTKDKISPEAGLNTLPTADSNGNPGYWRIGSESLLRSANHNYANAGRTLAWRVGSVLDNYYQPIVYGDPTTLPYLAPKYWDVEEKVWTGYVRADLDHDLSDSVRLKGNVGLQVIGTDQSSGSFEVINAYQPTQQVNRVTGGTTYTDVLPSINLAFMLPDDQAVRFGLAKTMARARMDQLKATMEVGYDSATGIPGGSGGNPELDPWRAWAYDLSYEKYFAGFKGYVSAAAFYKDLESYIYNQTDANHDYSDVLASLPPGFFAPGVVPKTTGNLTLPVNGDGGYLYGAEFAISVPFGSYVDWLDGFGTILSYSYTESDIEIQGSINSAQSDSITLPGLSKNVWNATLYYEKHGFAARIATRYRSSYIGEVTNFANDRALRYVDSDQITDAQVSYLFEEGSLQGLQLLFQINNLTNEPYVAYVEKKSRLLDYQEYGTQYLFGINYRF
jgi:TonB-dependent receptor